MRTPLLGVVVATLALATLAGPSAGAAPPTNDDIADATRITTLPTTLVQDTSEATGDTSDGRCVRGASVWFRFRPAEATTLRLTTIGSDYDTILAVFSGTRRSRTLLRCSDDAVAFLSAVRVKATAGTRYWIAVSSCCQRSTRGGALQLNAATAFPAPDGTVEVTKAESGGTSGGLIVSGTATCNTPTAVGVDVAARQRVGAGVARGFGGDIVATCMPGAETAWEMFIDSETGWAFQPGAPVRLEGDWGLLNGFDAQIENWETVLTTTDDPDGRPHGP